MPRLATISAFLALTAGAASADMTCDSFGATELVGGLRYCASSVLPPQGTNTYAPMNLLTGGMEQAWCEGVPGDGEGQVIRVEVIDGIPIRQMIVANGYQKSAGSFEANGRIRTAEIRTNRSAPVRITFPDTMGEMIVPLGGPAEYTWIELEIVDVWPGTRHRDTCITSLWLDFEYERSLEYQ